MDEHTPEYPITKGAPIQDSGSVFTGFAAKVYGIDDVASVLDSSLLMDGVASAAHRMYAYRYEDDKGTIYQNFDSDGDDGVGSEILKAMISEDVRNMIWIATRKCRPDYKHIGAKRFSHATDSCKEASNQL